MSPGTSSASPHSSYDYFLRLYRNRHFVWEEAVYMPWIRGEDGVAVTGSE